MNWHKAKTILIFFFIFINAFLLYFNITQNTAKQIDNQIIEYTVDIMSKNGVSIAPDIIPTKKISVPQFEADNIITDYESFAKTILGDNLQKISDTQFSSNNGLLEFIGDTFTYTSSSPLLSATPSETDIISLAHSFGISAAEYETSKIDNKTIFTSTANALEIFNSRIILENTETNTKLSGAWFCRLGENLTEDAALKDITSVLIDFLSSSERPVGNIEIKSLTPGYMLYETETYHKTLVPIPVWRIEHSLGTAYMDARANS